MAKKKGKQNKEFEEAKFKPGQSGNPKGRPKKFVTKVLTELQNEKGEKVSRQNIVDIYQVMLSLTKDDLVDLAKDDEKPFIYRIVAKEMLSKRGFDVIETMLNRANGKPMVLKEIKHELSTSITAVNFVSTGVDAIKSESEIIKKEINADK